MGLSHTLDKLSSERAASSEWLRTDTYYIHCGPEAASCSNLLEGRIKREERILRKGTESSPRTKKYHHVDFAVTGLVIDSRNFTAGV